MLPAQFGTYPATTTTTTTYGAQTLGAVPGVQTTVPGLGVQSIPGVQTYVQGLPTQGVQTVLPGMEVQGVVPGVQTVLPGTEIQGVVPGVQTVLPGMQVQGVVPGAQTYVQGLPVQSAVPGVQTYVQGLPVQGVVPGVAAVQQLPVTNYVQPLGSRYPVEQRYLGVGAPGVVNTLAASPYSRVTGLGVPAVGQQALLGVNPGLATVGGVDTSRYLQHVDILRNACQGAGTDEDAIVRVIANTTNQERALIRRLYMQRYNEDLVKRLQSELSGDFKDSAIGSFMTPTEYDAYCLYNAMKGLGTKEGVLSEIIGSRTPQELQAIKQVYAANYGETLDNAVAGDTSGDYRQLLLALLQCQRSQSPQANPTLCAQDAAALYQAGEGKWGTDEATFTRIFATRSPAELALINQYYKQHAGKGLLGAIDSEFSGDTKDLLDTIVRSNVDPYGFYAGRIHDSVSGLGTNDSRLIRNICARHAVDLPYIKQAYIRDYGKDMLQDIQGDTSGHYRQVLTSLVANAR